MIPNFEDMHVRALNSNIKQGYVYREEKSILPSKLSRADVLPRTWNKYYCAYVKDTKIFTMIAGNISAKTVSKQKCVKCKVAFAFHSPKSKSLYYIRSVIVAE